MIEAVQPKLNAFDIDAVTAFLRDALKVEHDALLEDIEYLHQCLEVRSPARLLRCAQHGSSKPRRSECAFSNAQSEAELHSTASQPPPTLTDLTQYSEKLQDTWIKVGSHRQHADAARILFCGAVVYAMLRCPSGI